MSYTATISWQKSPEEAFTDNKYSRTHHWSFDGGIRLTASSSPHVVPLPMSNEQAVDPEEALVASVSSCHMLWFLSLAAGRQLVVERYEDNAVGIMGKNEEGKTAMTHITLYPKIVFTGKIPAEEELEALHHEAHEKCFIASSLKTKIETVIVPAG